VHLEVSPSIPRPIGVEILGQVRLAFDTLRSGGTPDSVIFVGALLFFSGLTFLNFLISGTVCIPLVPKVTNRISALCPRYLFECLTVASISPA
jgi:hypothetical protein